MNITEAIKISRRSGRTARLSYPENMQRYTLAFAYNGCRWKTEIHGDNGMPVSVDSLIIDEVLQDEGWELDCYTGDWMDNLREGQARLGGWVAIRGGQVVKLKLSDYYLM